MRRCWRRRWSWKNTSPKTRPYAPRYRRSSFNTYGSAGQTGSPLSGARHQRCHFPPWWGSGQPWRTRSPGKLPSPPDSPSPSKLPTTRRGNAGDHGALGASHLGNQQRSRTCAPCTNLKTRSVREAACTLLLISLGTPPLRPWAAYGHSPEVPTWTGGPLRHSSLRRGGTCLGRRENFLGTQRRNFTSKLFHGPRAVAQDAVDCRDLIWC